MGKQSTCSNTVISHRSITLHPPFYSIYSVHTGDRTDFLLLSTTTNTVPLPVVTSCFHGHRVRRGPVTWYGDEVCSLSRVVRLHTGWGVGNRLRNYFGCGQHQVLRVSWYKVVLWQQECPPNAKELTNRDGRCHCCSMRGVRCHCHGDNSVTCHLGVWHSA